MKKQKSFLVFLAELEKAVLEDNIENFKNFSTSISNLITNANKETLKNYYNNPGNPIGNTNLVLLACKHNKVKIVKHLLDKHCRILNNLYVAMRGTNVLPDEEDETGHNAFYYAIRSGNIELLDMIIDKWPDNYFGDHLEELDVILSKAYEELQLKSVPLSDEMEIFVENKLINLRFFSNASPEQDQSFMGNLNNIGERIELILENISFLKTNYSNTEKVDKKFLFVAKSIAQNVYTLKQQLKSSYERLPWEEIEFCLVSFISSYTKYQEINLFYDAILPKSKLLSHLEHFAKKLEDEKDIIKDNVNIGKLAELPNLNREEVVAKVISSYPQFEELYHDYRQVKDVYSLNKINAYIELASSADSKNKEEQLIITRVLQVIAEYLKNTLDFPNLSNITSELFLLSLPKNTREIIVDLRNSLSHADSLSKRLDIEENADDNFFITIQNDIKKVGDVVIDFLYNYKIKAIRILLKNIVDNKNFDEIKEIAEMLRNVELDKIINPMLEYKNLEIHVNQLSNIVTDQTDFEKELFTRIADIVNFNKRITPTQGVITDYEMEVETLRDLNKLICLNDDNVIEEMKYYANRSLKYFTTKLKPNALKAIASLALSLSRSVRSRLQYDEIVEVRYFVLEIFYIAQLEASDLGGISWIEELREKFNQKGSLIPAHTQRKSNSLTEEMYNNHLARKLTQLKTILSNNFLSDSLIENLFFYKGDEKLRAALEMLVLDVMSILDLFKSKRYLENNFLFLDDNAPSLTGKCLRNHLAHDSALIEILSSDPSIAVLSNVKKLIEENLLQSDKKIGKFVNDDAVKLRANYNQGMVAISNEEKMFVAVQEGNLEDLKYCLKMGADIKARSIDSLTTLHYAAKGSSVEIVKFILDQNLSVRVKTNDNESPLHVAAAHGRLNIVEFFINTGGLYINDVNDKGKTPLHFAAENGHTKVVEFLFRNYAGTVSLGVDKNNCSPLHYAIRNKHIEVAKILLEDDDINEILDGFTPLHLAVNNGFLELVNFLLESGANPNDKSDTVWTPLHIAAFEGNLEIANVLIINKASVNARRVNTGCTPLHCAVEKSHTDETDDGTNVDTAKDAHKEIVKMLLKYEADANIVNDEGITPLYRAVRGNHLEIVNVLLEHGVTNTQVKDKNNDTLLHFAALNHQMKLVEVLIRNGAEINAKNTDDLTALHIICAQNKATKDIMNLLLKNNAEVNTKDSNGSTPLHAAVADGSEEIVKLLLENKAEVNTKTNDDMTPLHVAALRGNKDAIVLLINYEAEVNAKSNVGFTPLNLAVMSGHKDIVKLLIDNNAQVDSQDIAGGTPLYGAVKHGHKEIVEMLIENGANVNDKYLEVTLLVYAIKFNYIEIVEVLIANEADVNAQGGEALSIAVLAGYTDIVEILLNNNADVNINYVDNATALHLAAAGGHKKIVEMLLSRGAKVNALTVTDITPLGYAAQRGCGEVAEILIASGADVNVGENLTPLHRAAESGNDNVIKVLLNNKANINVEDIENNKPIDLALQCGHLQAVKTLLQHKKVNTDAKSDDDWKLLHIASQGRNMKRDACRDEKRSNFEIIKYLVVDEKYDINAKNDSDSKPIHIAAKNGYQDTVEFFLSKGSSINDRGEDNRTLLHLAASQGHLEVVKYLITQDADLNPKDADDSTPMHVAATFGYKDIIEVLLQNGAVYNAVNKSNKKPLEIANDQNVIELLTLTEKLFEAVNRNISSQVDEYMKAGAVANAKNADGMTPLHYAAWKGYEEVVEVLLKYKVNPNGIENKRRTPLHYAVKFSHMRVVKELLYNFAIFNAVDDDDKTPADFSEDESITDLFKLLNESFKKIKNSNSSVVNDLKKIKEASTVQIIMRANNRENQTLIAAAMHSNFSKIKELKLMLQDNMLSREIDLACALLDKGNFPTALSIFKKAFEIRKEIFGPDNLSTLDMQIGIAQAIMKQGAIQDALSMFEEILRKQQKVLSVNDNSTLITRGLIAMALNRLDRYAEAYNIYHKLYKTQKEVLGPNHSDTLQTRFNIITSLSYMEKYKEALNISKEVYESRQKTLGENDPSTLEVHNVTATIINMQGNYEEALQLHLERYEKAKVALPLDHAVTLKTLQNIGSIFYKQKKFQEALKYFLELFDIQKKFFGLHHVGTLNTQFDIASVFVSQCKWIAAIKLYRECFEPLKAHFGACYPMVIHIQQSIKNISSKLNLEGTDLSEILQVIKKNFNATASRGDINNIRLFLKKGADANDKDDGRTPLHHAVSNGHVDVVKVLLNSGAEVTQTTDEGETALHIASSKGHIEIIDVLLQHVNRGNLNDVINAKTTSSGATSLHIAAKNDSLDVIKFLLKKGAIYNVTNNEFKTPLDISEKLNANKLLKLIEELFRGAENGNIEIMEKLRAVEPDEFEAATNARNNNEKTLLQVAMLNKHMKVAGKLLEMLKKKDEK